MQKSGPAQAIRSFTSRFIAAMNPVNNTSLGKATLLLFSVAALPFISKAQMITGVWQGKINRQSVEIKIIKSGDSITGTSYYYAGGSYRRYSIRGYFDETTNEAVWWDDRLLEEKEGSLWSAPGKTPQLSRADFNCPGSGVMLLDGSSNEKNEQIKEGTVHLQKTSKDPRFRDEWDWVINNFTIGAADPYVIDSVATVAYRPKTETVLKKPTPGKPPKPGMVAIPAKKETTANPAPPEATATVTPQTIEEKFITRKKKVFTTIPVSGDSITLSFYDNAIVDGDSISLFLDGKRLFSHIRLSGKPYNLKIATADLQADSELVMVAENLGAIPPNTSYLVVMVGNERYTANLSSTEESSAVIRLTRKN